jgi:hypothetical protein
VRLIISSRSRELKGVEEYAIECSILKVAVSKMFKTVQMKEFKFFGGMGFSEALQWRVGERCSYLVSMKVQTKTECFLEC